MKELPHLLILSSCHLVILSSCHLVKKGETAMEFRLPELGEGVYEAELTAWLVKVGDSVKRGQNLMEVLTDKASMEVPSPFAGTIAKLNAEPGQVIKVGDAVLSYEAAGQKGDARADKARPEVKPEGKSRMIPARATARVAAEEPNHEPAAVSAPAALVRAAPSV